MALPEFDGLGSGRPAVATVEIDARMLRVAIARHFGVGYDDVRFAWREWIRGPGRSPEDSARDFADLWNAQPAHEQHELRCAARLAPFLRSAVVAAASRGGGLLDDVGRVTAGGLRVAEWARDLTDDFLRDVMRRGEEAFSEGRIDDPRAWGGWRNNTPWERVTPEEAERRGERREYGGKVRSRRERWNKTAGKGRASAQAQVWDAGRKGWRWRVGRGSRTPHAGRHVPAAAGSVNAHPRDHHRSPRMGSYRILAEGVVESRLNAVRCAEEHLAEWVGKADKVTPIAVRKWLEKENQRIATVAEAEARMRASPCSLCGREETDREEDRPDQCADAIACAEACLADEADAVLAAEDGREERMEERDE